MASLTVGQVLITSAPLIIVPADNGRVLLRLRNLGGEPNANRVFLGPTDQVSVTNGYQPNEASAPDFVLFDMHEAIYGVTFPGNERLISFLAYD